MNFDPIQADSPFGKALKEYETGMRNLGRSLIALSLLGMVAVVILIAVAPDLLFLAIIGTIVAIHAGLGALALGKQHWVNYAVIAWESLVIVLNCAGMGAEGQKDKGGATGGLPCIGLFIAAALIYYAVNNLKAYRKLKQADGDMNYPVQ